MHRSDSRHSDIEGSEPPYILALGKIFSSQTELCMSLKAGNYGTLEICFCMIVSDDSSGFELTRNCDKGVNPMPLCAFELTCFPGVFQRDDGDSGHLIDGVVSKGTLR